MSFNSILEVASIKTAEKPKFDTENAESGKDELLDPSGPTEPVRDSVGRFYMFVNPQSGSKFGGKILENCPERVVYSLKEDVIHYETENQKPKNQPLFNKNPKKSSKSFVGVFNKFDQIELKLTTLFSQEKRENLAMEVANLSKKHKNQKIKKSENLSIFVIPCGGDGTVCWVINTLLKFNCDFENICIVFLPVGTGNDLSVSTGHFGAIPVAKFAKSHVVGMLDLISLYLNDQKSIITKLDIWEAEVEVGSSGAIKQVHREALKEANKKQSSSKVLVSKKSLMDEKQEELKIYKTKLVNYCSVGIDARIGVGFDKKRTKSRFFNKMVYGWEGAKKIFCTGGGGKIKSIVQKMEFVVDLEDKLPTRKISKEMPGRGGGEDVTTQLKRLQAKKEDILKRYNTVHVNKDSQIDSVSSIEEKDLGDFKVTTKTVFKSDPAQNHAKDNSMVQPESVKPANANTSKEKANGDNKKVIEINPVTLIACNIDSYAGGIRNIWNKAKARTPIVAGSRNRLISSKQNPGDGKIEFLGFNSAFYFGICERVLGGGGNRIAQGKLQINALL